LGKDDRLGDVGERRLVEMALERLASSSNELVGDDCAAIDIGTKFLLASTDCIIKATHVPDIASPYQFGWYAAAVNLSDIAAMGGEPIGVLASFMAPADYPVSSLEEILRGLDECTATHGCSVLGGDTKQSSVLAIAGTALGLVNKGNILKRSAAKVGDIITVTGSLGNAAAGMLAIGSGSQEERPGFMKALLEPEPRIEAGKILGSKLGVHSCMDISDGLATTLHQIGRASGTGAIVEVNNIPAGPGVLEFADEIGKEALELTAYYGGDFELLVTMDPGTFLNISKSIETIGLPITIIGEVVDNGFFWSDGTNKQEMPDRGWEHFR
jgi:thiamine-monophosphate kinase